MILPIGVELGLRFGLRLDSKREGRRDKIDEGVEEVGMGMGVEDEVLGDEDEG